MARERTAAQSAALVAANRYRRIKANERKTRIALSAERMVRAGRAQEVKPVKFPVSTVRYINDGGRRLVVSQRYDDQVVLQTTEGLDYCRASVAEVEAFTHHKETK